MWEHPKGRCHILVTQGGHMTALWCTHCATGTLRGHMAAPQGQPSCHWDPEGTCSSTHHTMGTAMGPTAAPMMSQGPQGDPMHHPGGTRHITGTLRGAAVDIPLAGGAPITAWGPPGDPACSRDPTAAPWGHAATGTRTGRQRGTWGTLGRLRGSWGQTTPQETVF